MNKNLKVSLTYGIVGAICFFTGIKLHDYFNKDSNSIKATSQDSTVNSSEIKKDNIYQTYKGMYSYLADANNFRLCNSTENYPVSMEGKYLALERSYLSMNPAGKEVYVELSGHLKEIKSLEGDGGQKAFIIKKLIKIDSSMTCN